MGAYPAGIDPDLARANQAIDMTTRDALQSGQQVIVEALTGHIRIDLIVADAGTV
jgi:uncharacterized protein (UPF0262 family)